MLSKPDSGWSVFSLGKKKYQLSYLSDIANDWLDQAIKGLEMGKPFTVYGFLEPRRMLCTVSYWNTHIFLEDDDNVELDSKYANYETVHLNLIEFCEKLYDDTSNNIDDWVNWYEDDDIDFEKRKIELEDKVKRLKELIDKHKDDFADNEYYY